MNAEKPVEEMDVREVFILIEKHFNTEVAEKFEARKVDGKTLVLLSKRASQEQYEACGLLTVADQLKLSSVVNSSAESGSTGFEVTTIKPKKPSKAQLLQISGTARRIYKTKRKAIRTAAINRWPGNDIPNFKKNKVAVDELNDLVNDLKEDCSFPPLNFGKEGIKQHILDVLNERRRHKRKGHDYSQPDKRTLKRKVDQGTSSDSTSTDNDIGGSSSASGSSADHEEIGDSEETNNSGDTESVEESDENEDLDEDTAKLVVCVAFNAIQISQISRTQLQSSAKALKITTKKKEKNDLVKIVAEALVEKGFVKVLNGHSKKVSRDDIKKIKPF